MSVRVVTRSGGFRGPVPAGLLALLLLSGCCSRLQRASPGAKDVCLRLSSLGEKPGGFRCGYDAVRQMSRYIAINLTTMASGPIHFHLLRPTILSASCNASKTMLRFL